MCADFPPRGVPLNPPDGGRWTDDRLDDLANAVWAMRDLPQRVAVHETELHAMRDAHATEFRSFLEDLGECKRGIEKLHEIRSQERKERKRDFYAMLGAIFAAGMMVIAALGLFLA